MVTLPLSIAAQTNILSISACPLLHTSLKVFTREFPLQVILEVNAGVPPEVTVAAIPVHFGPVPPPPPGRVTCVGSVAFTGVLLVIHFPFTTMTFV